MKTLFVRQDREWSWRGPSDIDGQTREGLRAGTRANQWTRVMGAMILLLFLGCSDRKNAVSGTIEVDEAHVGPRMAGRVDKIFAQEGDRLRDGQIIAQLQASELRARRDLAVAQIDTAIRDADAQAAQLEFLRADAKRQQDLLKRKVVSPNDAERADST